VINLSFGGDDPDPILEQAIVYAFRRGSLVVSSAGNEGLDGNPLSYPASYPHVLTVAATGQAGTVASFSSESPYVDLAAPGVDIPVAEPIADDATGYISASGTSFSAPMVSGAAAWVWTARPGLDNTQLFDVLRLSARDIAPAGYDRATGFGMLDIPSALTFAPPAADPGEPNDAIDEVSPHGLFAGGEPAITTAAHPSATVVARVDHNEDPHDVYRVFVPAHGSLTAQTSGGTVDLRVYKSSAQNLYGRPFGASTRAGLLPDEVRFQNQFSRAVYAYVEVRPDPQTMRTSYTLRVTSSARR
jgi:subtilisin family serine protease